MTISARNVIKGKIARITPGRLTLKSSLSLLAE